VVPTRSAALALGLLGGEVLLLAASSVIDIVALELGIPAPWLSDISDWIYDVSRLLYFGGAAAFLVWNYRVMRHAHELGRPGLTTSPGNAVMWFFIPIAWFFMPYRVMRQLAMSVDPVGSGQPRWRVLAWWLLYQCFLWNAAIQVIAREVLGARHNPYFEAGWGIVASVIGAAALVALHATMRFIHRGQAHWAAQTTAAGLAQWSAASA
jgi:hypothetical protein